MLSKHILIVDDAIDLGRMLQDMLKTVYKGTSIMVVPSAEEAILEATRFEINLLITDIRLPGMTGFELVKKIRQRQPGVKVMMISGLALDDRLKSQLDAIQADIFFRKPMGMTEFLEACAQLLGLNSPAMPEMPSTQPEKRTESILAVKIKDAANESLLNGLAQAFPNVPRNELVIKPASIKTEAEEAHPKGLEQTGLSVHLSTLRATLGAVSVVLMDDHGRSVALAGDVLDSGWMEQLMADGITALSAGVRISHLLEADSYCAAQVFRGKTYDFTLAPIGNYALAVFVKRGGSVLRLALALEEVLAAQTELQELLEKMGLPVDTFATVPTESISEAPQESAADAGMIPDTQFVRLEELLQSQPAQLTQNADAFWEDADNTQRVNMNTPDVLTYEQAQKLGLLPDSGSESASSSLK